MEAGRRRFLENKKVQATVAANMEALQLKKYASKDTEGFHYTSAPNLSVAVLLNPPVQGGLMHCINELYSILHYTHKAQVGIPPLNRLQQVNGKFNNHLAKV